MFKFLSKLAAILIFTLLIGGSSVLASGKLEVKIGERVDLVGESTNPRAQYKWVVKKGAEILSTQSGRNFSFNFPYQGEYVINLTATDGALVESTTIHVLAGERYPRPFEGEGVVVPGAPPLYLFLETLPYRSPEGQVTLLGDGKVYFHSAQSVGDILEYRIDKNIFVDSDGNGVANDDIDNVNDDSYLTGQFWQATYRRGEEPKIVAEITLVDKSGQKAKEQVEIVFGDRVDTGPPIAALDALPMPREDGLILLYEDPHKVAFYARGSEGKILEYRIDKNIFEDSDGDGNASNDIDNLNDISFKTGDVWETEYAKTEEQIIAQLIVVGEQGMGSRIQKGIVFGEKPTPVIPLEEVEDGIRLTADKDFVVKGDPITFAVKGLQLALSEYTFEWDFDGDGEMNKEVEGDNSAMHIYEIPGVFEVRVKITDREGNTAERTLEITSKDTVATKADFTFNVDANTVTFTNLSTVNLSLADKTLDYAWSFGDTDPEGYEEQRDQIGVADPVYTYRKAGKYLITLTITDADQVTDSKSAEIEILQDFVPAEEGVVEPEEKKEVKEKGPLFWRLLKILLYLIVIVIVLILVIIGGFLAFFKVQHPDLTFEELVDELKAKILSMIGAPEMAEAPKAEAPPTEAPPVEEKEEVPTPPEEAPEEEKPAPEAPPAAEAGPTPPWMKEKEVIEGEVEEEVAPAPEASAEEEAPPAPEATVEEVPTEEEVPPAPEAPEVPPAEEEAPPPAEAPEAPPEKPEEAAPPPEEKPVEEEKKPPEGGEPAEPAEGEEGPVPDWLKGV